MDNSVIYWVFELCQSVCLCGPKLQANDASRTGPKEIGRKQQQATLRACPDNNVFCGDKKGGKSCR